MNMSLSEYAPKKLSKNKVIASGVEYQKKVYSTLENINK